MYNSFADQLTYEQIDIARGRKWEWLGYVLVPVIYLIKFTLLALVLGTGLWFATDRFEFRSLVRAAVLAEFVFLVPMLLKIGWFRFDSIPSKAEIIQRINRRPSGREERSKR